MLKLLWGIREHAPPENFENLSSQKCDLLHCVPLSSYIYNCILKVKIRDRCPNYFRDTSRQFLILLSTVCIVKILNDFREIGTDPDNKSYGVTENNRDKRPSVPIANEKLIIWVQNNP